MNFLLVVALFVSNTVLLYTLWKIHNYNVWLAAGLAALLLTGLQYWAYEVMEILETLVRLHK